MQRRRQPESAAQISGDSMATLIATLRDAVFLAATVSEIEQLTPSA
jgi:hypothetical protein